MVGSVASFFDGQIRVRSFLESWIRMSTLPGSATLLSFQESQAIIEKHNPSKPLFLYLPFMSVHTPFVGTIPNR